MIFFNYRDFHIVKLINSTRGEENKAADHSMRINLGTNVLLRTLS